MHAKWLALGTAVVLTLSGAAMAQQTPPPAAPMPAPGMGQGQSMMRGGDERHHGMMRGHGMEMGGMMMGRRFCDSKEAMALRMLGRLESTIKPTDAQKPEMEALRAAATKAESIMRAACPAAGDDDRSPPPVSRKWKRAPAPWRKRSRPCARLSTRFMRNSTTSSATAYAGHAAIIEGSFRARR